MRIAAEKRRGERLVGRLLRSPAYGFGDVADPRARRGRRWRLDALLTVAFLGMLLGRRTLRDVESSSEEIASRWRLRVPRRVPDTTLYQTIERMSAEAMREKLYAQVRTLRRKKLLEPEGLPCGVAAFDGKSLGALDHHADGAAQKATREDGSPYWLMRVMRVALTSAASKPCIEQVAVPAETNETGTFQAVFDGVLRAYGHELFEVVTGDAAYSSRSNATHVDARGKAYVFALKESQPELLAETRRLLDARLGKSADAETPWERVRGGEVRRRLYRTAEIAAYHGWAHLRQAWRVVSETRRDGKIQHETRYFLTNLRVGRLTPMQCLLVVRNHWGIENDCFWSLDTQWGEDSAPWCTKGRSTEVIGLLRVMAYNLLQLARKRYLRRRDDAKRFIDAPLAWRRLFDWSRVVLLRFDDDLASVCG